MHAVDFVVYPIKSCRGISRNELSVSRRGLADDRRYMLVDERGVFVTQRTEPTLCLVDVIDDGTTFRAEREGSGAVSVPKVLAEGERLSASVWRDTVPAIVHPAGTEWFSDYLKKPVRLVYVGDADLRQVDPRYGEIGDRVGFADGYPLLALSRASLENLNRLLAEKGHGPLPVERFRPNLVLDGATPHEEDQLGKFTINGVPFFMAKLCERCVVTTIDPKSAEKGLEPLKTLASYRKWDGAVWFGANVIPRGEGTLRRGDELVPERA